MNIAHAPTHPQSEPVQAEPLSKVGLLWARLKRIFRPPRRLRPTRAGAFTLFAPFVLGVAAINATNNLLFILLGVCLGLIVLSGIVSERNIRGINAKVDASGDAYVGEPARLTVSFQTEGWKSGASYELRIRERLTGAEKRKAKKSKRPFNHIDVTLPLLEGKTGRVLTRRMFERRGRHDLSGFELMTHYPFGLFNKIRDVDVSSTLVVWPRRIEVPSSLADPRGIAADGRSAGHRGLGQDVFGLREREDWDSLHRVHALRSVCLGRDVVLETESLIRPIAWLGIVNSEQADPVAFERALEIAAATLVEWDRQSYAVGLGTVDRRIPPGTASLRELLDVVATLERVRVGGQDAVEGTAVWLVPTGASVPHRSASPVRATVAVDAQGKVSLDEGRTA